MVLETVDGARGAGRTHGQAPEVDGETLLDLSEHPELRAGDYILARVTGAGAYDLQAKPLHLLHRPPLRGRDLLQIGVLR